MQVIEAVVAWASDPLSAQWYDVIRDSIFAMLLATIVVASFRGWITWPPEKKRMQDTIDLLVEELKRSNANTERALPTTARLVEVVDQRVHEPEQIAISHEALVAALREAMGR